MKGIRRDDPPELVAVATPGYLEEMAEVPGEEYTPLGGREDQLLALFRDHFFQATHHIYHQKGEEYVGSLIRRALGRWAIHPQEGAGL